MVDHHTVHPRQSYVIQYLNKETIKNCPKIKGIVKRKKEIEKKEIVKRKEKIKVKRLNKRLNCARSDFLCFNCIPFDSVSC